MFNTGDLIETKSITDYYGLYLLEDATESLGSKFIAGKVAGKYLGTLGDLGVFSFNENKIITTGGGGMVVSDNLNHLNRIRYFSTQAKDDSFTFQHNHIWFYYRMTNIQATMELAQLEKLEEFISIKRKNYELYESFFEDADGMKMSDFNDDLRPNYWFYSLLTKKDKIEDLISLVYKPEENNISVRPIWKLSHDQKSYEQFFSMPMSVSNYYYHKILNLPCSSNLTKEDFKCVYKAILECSHG